MLFMFKHFLCNPVRLSCSQSVRKATLSKNYFTTYCTYILGRAAHAPQGGSSWHDILHLYIVLGELRMRSGVS